MKKITLLIISILMVTAAFAQTGNPIPSYNVLVSNGSYFQDSKSAFSVTGNTDSSKERRDMNVSNEGSAGGGNGPQGQGPDVVVYIYKAIGDYKVLGPFVIHDGTTLTVPIDNSSWGVNVVSNSITYISVWTNDKQ